ncbi:MAG: DUF1295 domain-containing protein [Promethearchaeota archaeon]|jgi:protein-S-isoprenylcysteine O-methyltransferase Ste14
MYGDKETSLTTRFLILIAYSFIIIVILWIYFLGGIQLVGSIFGNSLRAGDFLRRVVLFSFSIIYFLRIIITLFIFLKRKVKWDETFAIIFAIAFYNIGFSITGSLQSAPISYFDLLPIGLFIFGSYLNSYSEYQRKKFKDIPANTGKIYTQGLFRFARHINYFGDFVWISAFALMTINIWSSVMPLLCIISFIFFNIPALDKYLDKKYGEDYKVWAKKTKNLIPFIY